MATFGKATFNAVNYAAARPTYPRELFNHVFRYHEHGSLDKVILRSASVIYDLENPEWVVTSPHIGRILDLRHGIRQSILVVEQVKWSNLNS